MGRRGDVVMESTLSTLPFAASALCLWMALLWAIQRRTGDAGLADFGWSVGIGVTGVLLCLDGSGYLPRRLLAAALLAVWSVRLSWHLLTNRILPADEDSRYAMLRQRWGQGVQPRFFAYFQLQAVLVLPFALPYLATANGAMLSLTLWDAAEIHGGRWWTLIPPLLLFVLLRYVTGIPHAERRALATRADYAQYQQTTSAFVPCLPRKA